MQNIDLKKESEIKTLSEMIAIVVVNIASFFGLLLICAVIGFLIGGCSKTVYVPVESVTIRNDTIIHLMRQILIRQQSIRDTERIHTSERITEKFVLNEKGDTIGHDRDREAVTDRTKELEATISEQKAVIDSLSAVRRDSIEVPKPYPVEVVREVEKKLHWWQTALMWVGAAMLIFSVANIVKKRIEKG